MQPATLLVISAWKLHASWHTNTTLYKKKGDNSRQEHNTWHNICYVREAASVVWRCRWSSLLPLTSSVLAAPVTDSAVRGRWWIPNLHPGAQRIWLSVMWLTDDLSGCSDWPSNQQQRGPSVMTASPLLSTRDLLLRVPDEYDLQLSAVVFFVDVPKWMKKTRTTRKIYLIGDISHNYPHHVTSIQHRHDMSLCYDGNKPDVR